MNREKSLVKNSIFNVVYKLLNVLFPLITATYTARVLTATGVGKVAYAQNIVMYFATIAALGIPNYGTREIAKRRNNRHKMNELFSELVLINSISTTVCLILYVSLILSFSLFRTNIYLYTAAGLAIAFNYLNVDWVYQGLEEYGYIVVRSFVVKIISLICVLAIVKNPNDTTLYAAIYCLGIGGNNLFNIINLKKYNICLVTQNINIKKHLKSIFVLLTSVIAIELYTLVDTTMIGIWCDDVNVAYYTNSMKLVKLLINVVAAIGAVLLPRLSYYHSIGKNDECSNIVSKVCTIMLMLLVPCEVGMLFIADKVMPFFFGITFIPAVPTLRIASLLICVLGFSNLFGTQVLLTYGAEKKLLICTIVGAFSNISMNAIFIPAYAQNGAAIASVISEALVTLLSIILARKYIDIKLNAKATRSIIVAVIAMALSIYFIQKSNTSDIVKLFLSVGIGSIVYVSVNVVMKNPIIEELREILENRRIKAIK